MHNIPSAVNQATPNYTLETCNYSSLRLYFTSDVSARLNINNNGLFLGCEVAAGDLCGLFCL